MTTKETETPTTEQFTAACDLSLARVQALRGPYFFPCEYPWDPTNDYIVEAWEKIPDLLAREIEAVATATITSDVIHAIETAKANQPSYELAEVDGAKFTTFHELVAMAVLIAPGVVRKPRPLDESWPYQWPLNTWDAELRREAALAMKNDGESATDVMAIVQQQHAATPDPDSDAPTPPKRVSRQRQRVEKAAQALIILNEHPDWTDKRIATEVGVTPGTLSRWPEYRAGVAIAANEGKRRLPRGWRTDDGGIEATD